MHARRVMKIPTPLPSPPVLRALRGAVLSAGLTIAFTGCAGSASEPPGERAPRPGEPAAPADSVVPLPLADGPLDLRVSYPRSGVLVRTRGENFIFGSTGSGDARLWIEGVEVEVRRNGAFLAFLPVPDDGIYDLRATLDGEERTLALEVPLPPPPPEGDVVVDPASIGPSGAWAALPGERVEASFRGTPGGIGALVLPGGARIPLLEGTATPGGATDFELLDEEGSGSAAETDGLVPYRGFLTARPLVARDTTVAWPSLAEGPRPGVVEGDSHAFVELTVGGRTVRHPLSLNLVVVDPDRPRVGEAHDPRPPEENGDGRVIARPGPGGGPYHYEWLNGTELELTGERNAAYRVRLTDDLHAWTPVWDVTLRDEGTAPPTSRVGVVRMDPGPEWIDVHVGLDRRLPYRVDEDGSSLTLRVYGATSRVNFLQHGGLDPFVLRGEWSQPSDRLFRLDLHLASSPWGYETFWSEGGDLVLRVRRPPVLDPADPLDGLVVGVDPGHGGEDRETMGPTGLTEADANLGIGLALRDELERRGARVVMTRTTDTTVSLVERTELARRENVDVWISVHNNAFPDGIDPWANNGTSVFYNHPRSAGLARAIQGQLLPALGLRDLGAGRADLHQARFTWAPSVLSENAYLMIPEQEALLSSPEGQRRIAMAHVRGLVEWLGQRATSGW